MRLFSFFLFFFFFISLGLINDVQDELELPLLLGRHDKKLLCHGVDELHADICEGSTVAHRREGQGRVGFVVHDAVRGHRDGHNSDVVGSTATPETRTLKHAVGFELPKLALYSH